MHVPLHIQILYDTYVEHATLLVVMLEIQTLNVTVSNLMKLKPISRIEIPKNYIT